MNKIITKLSSDELRRVTVYPSPWVENPRGQEENISHIVMVNRFVSLGDRGLVFDNVLGCLCAAYNVNREELTFKGVLEALGEHIVILPIKLADKDSLKLIYVSPDNMYGSEIVGFGYCQWKDYNYGQSQPGPEPGWQSIARDMMRLELLEYNTYLGRTAYDAMLEARNSVNDEWEFITGTTEYYGDPNVIAEKGLAGDWED